MKKLTIFVIFGVAIIVIIALVYWWRLPSDKLQTAFACPLVKETVIKETMQERNLVTDALKSPERENTITVFMRELKQKYPSANNTDIVDYLMSAYCPLVEKQADLSASEKRARMDSFSSQLFQISSSN